MGFTGRFWLEYGGELLELSARRDRLRTRVTLWRDGRSVGEAAGSARILLPLEPVEDQAEDPDSGDGEVLRGPTVLVLSALPGVVNRAMLLVPRAAADADRQDGGPGGPAIPPAAVDEVLAALPKSVAKLAGLAAARRHPFASPPGSFAARLASFATRHPRLWAARHVALAVAKVGLGLLGLALFVQVLLRQVLAWLAGLLPDWDLPAIPWPDIDLPDIPWPDIDLPDLVAPGWLLVLVGTAKFWGPVLLAIGIAVVEVRRRARRRDVDGAAVDREGAGRAEP